jgi:cytoskeletal protein RodZ
METTQKPKNKTAIIVVIVLAVLAILCVLCSLVIWFLFSASSRVIKSEFDKIETQVQENTKREPEVLEPNEGTPTPTASESQGEPGQVIGTDIPEKFPKDFPLYPESSVGYASSNNENGELAVNFEAEVSNARVIEFYKKELPEKGWKIIQEITIFGHSFVASKGDLRAGVIILGDQTATTYVVTLEGIK